MGAHTPRGPRHGDNRVALFSMMTSMNSKELMNFAAAGKKNKNTHTNTHTKKKPCMDACLHSSGPAWCKKELANKKVIQWLPE